MGGVALGMGTTLPTSWREQRLEARAGRGKAACSHCGGHRPAPGRARAEDRGPTQPALACFGQFQLHIHLRLQRAVALDGPGGQH